MQWTGYEFKDLGVWFDPKLTFVKHMEIIRAKSYAMLGFVKRICFNMSNPYALKSIYCAYVRSRLEYASIVWQPYVDVHSFKIESVQKQFVLFALSKLGWSRETMCHTNRGVL